MQANYGGIGLGPENNLHSAAVIHVVFGDRSIGGIQFRVQKNLVTLWLNGQKWYLIVRNTRVSLLYERITIYVLNNDNINPINVRVLFCEFHTGLYNLSTLFLRVLF